MERASAEVSEVLEKTESTAAPSLDLPGAGGPPRAAAGVELDRGQGERRVRADLRRQIASLEHQLGELFASAFPRKGIGYSVAAVGGPRVLGVDELERVRDRLAGRLRDAQDELARRTYVEERNRETLERMIAAPDSFRWLRISNDDIGEPGCRHWHSRPRWGPLGMLLRWWRVKLSSGCP